MTTEFPPSTFPTMSLGTPANLASPSSQHNNNNAIPTSIMSPEGVQSVLSAIQACSSHNASIRRPAEQQLQQWENASSEGMLVGYLSNLITIMQQEKDDNTMRLLTAILLKNAIPKVFSVPLPSLEEDSEASLLLQQQPNNEKEILSQSYKERALVRDQLPLLIFNEGNTTIALHLQLAMSNIALFDFPKLWPNMLDTLMHAASSSPPPLSDKMGALMSNETKEKLYLMSTRGIKTLRLCLQSIRQRKMIVPTAKGKSRGHPMMMMMNMGNLGSIIGKAVNERKEMHDRACSIFEQLAMGIVKHCQAAVGGENVSSSSVSASHWQADSILAVGYIKCMTELLPMVEIENIATDPRTAAVRQLLSSLVQICDAVKVYPAPSIPPPLASIPNIQQEYTIKMDKIFRATIICCISAIRTNPQLASPIVSQILQIVVEPILTLDSTILQNMPVKRLMDMTGLIRVILMCVMYDEKRKDSLLAGGSKNAVLAMLSGRKGGGGGNEGNDNNTNPNNDPGVIDAQQTVTALLAEGTIERLCESLVGKFLRLHPEEIEEWENDPEGRYETDLAEKSLLEADSPRHCGGALLLTLMNREPDRVAKTLLELTQKVYQQLPPEDVNGMLNREACYRSLELCHKAMVGRGERLLNFSDWFGAELLPILQTDLGDDSPVAMRAMQARAVQVVQAYSTSLKTEEFGVAFQTIARLIASNDLVTAFCAARCINHLALLHVKGESESTELANVREYSVLALGNAFTLANRAESEECLRVTLMCVSALVEANGLYLEPVLQAIAEQLPSLWERAQDSVTIHSSLVSVLQHLIMKMGYSTVENEHVQKVLFPLLDYCTDISVANRADNLLEDGLRLWLVVLVSSRLATMGASLRSMLPRLADIIRTGLEPHLSLKVLQFNTLLLGRQVLEPHATILRDLLLNLTSCIYLEQTGGDDTMGDNVERSTGPDRGGTTTRNAVAALTFAEGILQLLPDELSLSICAPAISKVIAVLPDKQSVPAPVLEAAFGSLGRMLWMRPTCLDEIFGGEKQEEKIASIVRQFLAVATSVSVLVMLSVKAQKVTFINQKKSMLSLCSAVCQSRTVARASGHEVLNYTRRLLEAESKSTAVSDLDSLVEAACGTTRKVVGDGPLGDSAALTKEVLKSE